MKWAVTMVGVIALALAALLLIEAAYEPQCEGDAPKGTVISIPGETMEILSEPHEERLRLDVVRDPFDIPNYQMQPAHGHIDPHQAEGFRVLEGRAKVLVADHVHTLEVGDTVVVPANTIHHWMALDDQPVRVEAYFDPPLDMAGCFVHFQKHIAQDSMNLLQAAVISREFVRSSPAPVQPSPWVWNVLARLIARVGRALGYQPC